MPNQLFNIFHSFQLVETQNKMLANRLKLKVFTYEATCGNPCTPPTGAHMLHSVGTHFRAFDTGYHWGGLNMDSTIKRALGHQ